MASFETSTHVVIFPFMSQGHPLPLLDISNALSYRGLKITIITTPSNATSILPHIAKHPQIHLTEIPFPSIDGLPEGCKNTAQLPSLDFLVPFLTATSELQRPFNHVIRRMIKDGSRPICVISDFFLVGPLPLVISTSLGLSSMEWVLYQWLYVNQYGNISYTYRIINSDTKPLHLPETQLPFTLTKSDLPENYRFLEDDCPLPRFLAESGETDVESWGMLLNSFSDSDGCHLSFLEPFYKNGAKTWCIGLSLLYNDETNGTHNKSPSSSNYLDWLNQRISKPTSVIYISFGTQAYLSDADLNEVGLGLKMSGHEFLWVVKSQTWSPPDELEERLKGRGLIVRDWVDQQRILAHNAVGGFLSHCGWNSVMKSLSMGVPLLVLPMNAEKPLNAKQVVDELGAGLRVEMGGPFGWGKLSIQRQAICDGVRELMSGEEGKKVREKAEDLGRAAQQAVKEGGSSYKSLTEMIDILQARQTGVSN